MPDGWVNENRFAKGAAWILGVRTGLRVRTHIRSEPRQTRDIEAFITIFPE